VFSELPTEPQYLDDNVLQTIPRLSMHMPLVLQRESTRGGHPRPGNLKVQLELVSEPVIVTTDLEHFSSDTLRLCPHGR
jgi:hypothetical protein